MLSDERVKTLQSFQAKDVPQTVRRYFPPIAGKSLSSLYQIIEFTFEDRTKIAASIRAMASKL